MRVAMDSDLELLGERIAEQAAHLDAAMYRFLTDLREFDEARRLAQAGCVVVCALAVPGGLAGTRSPGASVSAWLASSANSP